jgi:hypothetical protein
MANSPRHRWQFNWQPQGSQLLHAPTGLVADRQGTLTGDTAPILDKHGPHNTPRILRRLSAEALAVWATIDAGRPIPTARLPHGRD